MYRLSDRMAVRGGTEWKTEVTKETRTASGESKCSGAVKGCTGLIKKESKACYIPAPSKRCLFTAS